MRLIDVYFNFGEIISKGWLRTTQYYSPETDKGRQCYAKADELNLMSLYHHGKREEIEDAIHASGEWSKYRELFHAADHPGATPYEKGELKRFIGRHAKQVAESRAQHLGVGHE